MLLTAPTAVKMPDGKYGSALAKASLHVQAVSAACLINGFQRVAFFNQLLRRITEEEAHQVKAYNHTGCFSQPGNCDAQWQAENQTVGCRKKNRRENAAGINQHIQHKTD